MLTGVSIFCFAASYLVALALEFTRFLVRAQIQKIVMIGFAAAGLLAHLIYIFLETQRVVGAGLSPYSWYLGCLILACLLIVLYLALVLRKANSSAGLFLLPASLLLVGTAHLIPRETLLGSANSLNLWAIIHGVALLLGTTSVVIGFVAGILYLVESYWLKKKRPPKRGFIPSLEALHRLCERSLLISSFLLGLGVASGILRNWLMLDDGQAIPWSDPLVWTSGLLLAWVIAVSLFQVLYRPSREGRKVAYLTVASFVFFGIILVTLLMVPNQHMKTVFVSHQDFISPATYEDQQLREGIHR